VTEYLQSSIKKGLDATKERVKARDKDAVFLVTGGEGNGKSSLSILMANYLDPDFDASEQIVMDHEDLIRTADELSSYQSIVFDEGIESLLSRNHGKSRNKMMIEWFREVRAKNLFIFVNMPEFKEIEKPIRDDRAHMLVRCVKQGWAHFYNEDRMQDIVVERRGNRVRAEYSDPIFKAGWKDPSDLDLWPAYQEMKKENVSNLAEKYLDGGEDDNADKYEKKLRRLRMRVAKTGVKAGMSQSDSMRDLLDMDPSTYTRWKKKGELGNIPPFKQLIDDVQDETHA